MTILGHVDHGKITLCYILISQSNGSLSAKTAGSVRLLDGMDEEVRRGITIRSTCSGIGLLYNSGQFPNCCNMKPLEEETKLFNVLDSPGHIDFSHEVLTSLSLTEGSVLFVERFRESGK